MKRFPILIVTTFACCALAACFTRRTRMVKEMTDALTKADAVEFPAELTTQWRYPGSEIQAVMTSNTDTLKDGVIALVTPDSFESVALYYKSLDSESCKLGHTTQSTDADGSRDVIMFFSPKVLDVAISISEDSDSSYIAVIYTSKTTE